MSDYLSDEEQVARLQSWWRSNGVITILAIVLAIAAVVGWRWYQGQQAASVAAASDLYTAYTEADDSGRQAKLTQLLGEHPGSTYAAFALMDQAKRASAAGNLDAAVKHYQDVLGKNPEAVIADLANVRLARLLQQQEESDAALTALSSVRGSGFRAQVAELKGDILLQQGNRAGANEAYLAALAASTPGEERPVLNMKENITSAPVDGSESTSASQPDSQLANEVEAEIEAEIDTQAEVTGLPDQPSEVDSLVNSPSDASSD